jgi:hypothetical protein
MEIYILPLDVLAIMDIVPYIIVKLSISNLTRTMNL